MSTQNPREQINKASWNLVEGIKDAVSANLAAASHQAKLDVKGDVLQRLLTLVNASIEEGFHRGNRVFTKAVDKAMADASMPTLTPSKKKSA